MRMHSRQMSFAGVALGLCAAVLVPPPAARAFAEDICYTEDGAPAHNCGPLPPVCPLDDPDAPVCGLQAFAAYGFTLRRPLGGRSLVHTDSTYVIARDVGFSERDAYWIAAYDEATDLGAFAPRDVAGRLVPDADSLTTQDISGLVRTHFATGGFLFHFLPTMRGPSDPQPDGLSPDADDPAHEVMLTHLRRWAMAGPGSAAPLCTGGFTNPSAAGDYATGATCYGDAQPAQIHGEYAVETPVAIPFDNETGEQVISGDVRSGQFDSWIGDNAWNARTGIYLHALGDRISHRACTDAGTITPPSPDRPEFRIDLNKPTCDPPRVRDGCGLRRARAGGPDDRGDAVDGLRRTGRLRAGPRNARRARDAPRDQDGTRLRRLGAGVADQGTGRADDRGDRGRLPGRGGAVPGHADLPCLTVSVVSRPVVIARHSPQ